jgi:hypothetical protein
MLVLFIFIFMFLKDGGNYTVGNSVGIEREDRDRSISKMSTIEPLIA